MSGLIIHTSIPFGNDVFTCSKSNRCTAAWAFLIYAPVVRRVGADDVAIVYAVGCETLESGRCSHTLRNARNYPTVFGTTPPVQRAKYRITGGQFHPSPDHNQRRDHTYICHTLQTSISRVKVRLLSSGVCVVHIELGKAHHQPPTAG